jgi:endonuclease G
MIFHDFEQELVMQRWDKAERYLRRICESDGITEDHLLQMRDRITAEKGNKPSLESTSRFRHGDVRHQPEGLAAGSRVIEQALDSWRRFRRGQALSEDDKIRIEAIILPNGLRPAFDITEDSFEELPDPWRSLNAHRPLLHSCIRAVGRVNVPGHARLQYAGTAFIVGDGLLLTNRHVADEFCQTGSTDLVFTPGISPSLDMRQEVGSGVSVVVKVSKPLLMVSDWDAALLRISEMPPNAKPLPLAGSPPPDSTGRLATVIGYPALDTQCSTEEILQQVQIFRAIFDKKRLQPGRLLGMLQTSSFGRKVNALAHDCTTLGGNSGSVLVDVDAEAILGLHFGGEYLVANYAVPSWELARNQRLRDEGVMFA